jgi:D-alanyl-D-alanine carboxypeptidase/D-alanyl-D-alanine-endopeptidase (penicillin-binding protein 4)
MWEHPLRYDYLTTLPVSGRSGTLASRFENSTAIGKVRAKTGTLSIASGLAGYAFAGNDEPIAFAFVVNYYQRGIREITNAQEEIAELLTRADFSPPPPDQASNE